MYFGGSLLVRDDAAATIHNIAAHEHFRFGIICDLIARLGCRLAALALYELLKGVDRQLGVLITIPGGLIPCALAFVHVLNDAATIVIARGERFVSPFDTPPPAALAALFLPKVRRGRARGFGY